MKANNGTGNNIDRDEWETPQWLYDKLHTQYNFQIDLCANKNNTKCKTWITQLETANITLHKNTKAWMNPPFSKAKEMFTQFFKKAGSGIAIYRCDNMETEVWQKIIIPNATWIHIPDKRISYEGLAGTGARFPTAIIGHNTKTPTGITGHTLHTKKGRETHKERIIQAFGWKKGTKEYEDMMKNPKTYTLTLWEALKIHEEEE